MVALSADIQRLLDSGRDYRPRSYPVKAGAVIFDGAALCIEAADGYARPVAIGLTAPEFLGFAREAVNNAAGASGAVNVLVGSAVTLTIPNTTAMFAAGVMTIVNVNDLVYMNDDGTGFTLTVGAAGTLAVLIGKIANVVNGTVVIECGAASTRSA